MMLTFVSAACFGFTPQIETMFQIKTQQSHIFAVIAEYPIVLQVFLMDPRLDIVHAFPIEPMGVEYKPV